MDKKRLILGFAFIAILVSSACVVTVPALGPEPAGPAEKNTDGLLQTEQPQPQAEPPTSTPVFTETLAPTLTVIATPTLFPTITPLPTLTLTPSITLTPIEVDVATLGLEIPHETLTQMALTPLSSGDPAGSQYACLVTAKRVADKTVYGPNVGFTAWFDVVNVGQKRWNNGLVEISLAEGPRLSVDRKYPLPSEPRPGESVRLKIEIKTPANEGPYKMVWGLRDLRSNRHFCFFTIIIIVKK